MTAPSAANGDAQTLDVVLFTRGAARVGVEARWVRSARRVGEPGDRQADDDWSGMAPETRHLCQRLNLRHPAPDGPGSWEVWVAGPVDLAHLPVASIHALPPLLAARTRVKGLCALALPPASGVATVVLLLDAARCVGAQSAASGN